MQNQTPKRPEIRNTNVVFDCADADELASFYSQFLGWPYTHPRAEGWAAITSPTGTVYAFQEVEGYRPPTWPWEPGTQGQMVHFDYWVDNLEEAVAFAVGLGARLAQTQYFATSCTLLDPAGHTFCIDTEGEEPQ